VRGEHLLDGTKSAAAEFTRHRVGSGSVGIDNTYQPHRFSLLLQFTVNSGMIASKDAYAHDCDGDRIVSLQERTLGWPVATRNNKL
jgi:hypothetical protein